jgi:hypothetical protein
MVEIITKDWPHWLWHEAIEWCINTFGCKGWGKIWFFQDDYILYIHEEYLSFFMLRWQ